MYLNTRDSRQLRQRKGSRKDRNALQQKGGTDYGRFTAGYREYVELRNINKTYGTFKASNNINLGIGKGKLIALLGPSGSGKTTILRMIAGLETADSGDIIIDGKVVNDVPASKRGIGFVFQNYALFRYMTVYDNIAFGLKVNKWKKSDIKKRVDELMSLSDFQAWRKDTLASYQVDRDRE